VYFFDTKQNTESSLRADYAHFDSKKDLWDYRGKVELKNQKGDILTTEQLYADRKREKLYSQKLVKIATSDGSMIEGAEGFTSNLDFTEYEFRDVTSEIPGK
jgi:LPS export ABC transporter protein LptC